ncbi:hypothetical protein E2C01_009033 [Portunus trituberculatus]|uniref:Uncharacterized protein n=1 Tax=Portunus trituberculatus TaxID=210409 RepID=A0A5B7D5N8_PORTR|nr:hypothetical protein [Portunus trituberculatus]
MQQTSLPKSVMRPFKPGNEVLLFLITPGNALHTLLFRSRRTSRRLPAVSVSVLRLLNFPTAIETCGSSFLGDMTPWRWSYPGRAVQRSHSSRKNR